MVCICLHWWVMQHWPTMTIKFPQHRIIQHYDQRKWRDIDFCGPQPCGTHDYLNDFNSIKVDINRQMDIQRHPSTKKKDQEGTWKIFKHRHCCLQVAHVHQRVDSWWQKLLGKTRLVGPEVPGYWLVTCIVWGRYSNRSRHDVQNALRTWHHLQLLWLNPWSYAGFWRNTLREKVY